MNKFALDALWPVAGHMGMAVTLALAVLGTSAVSAQTPTPAVKAAAKPAAARASFATPQAGVEALVAALRRQDAAALRTLLGPDSLRLIDSGDSAADRAGWERFVADYDARHELRMKAASKAVLSVGPSDWPMPIPLVKRGGAWVFDTAAGVEELIARRIGRNELDAIQVCLAFVDMQREYAELDRDGDGLLEYTSRLLSTRGRQDGLYWQAAPGEPPSPAGPRLARATPDQLAARTPATPYHGYLYRVLNSQGPHAPGGARDYRIDGHMIGGFAMIAWPASYLSSGVKSFMCSMDGIVYERDFGTNTAAAVAKIAAFDPGPGWSQVKP